MACARKNSKIAVLFVDEVILQRKTPNISRCWAIKGCQPEIPFELGHHERLHLFGAVNTQTGKTHIRKCSKINSASFVSFLRQTKANYVNGKLILIIDNAPWHRSKMVKLEASKLKINLFYLPSYSPDLNPIERLWKRLRRDVTHNTFFQNMNHLKRALNRFFKYLDSHQDEIVSLCQLR